MKLFLSFLLMLNTVVAFGAFPKPPDVRFELNTSPYGNHTQLGTQIIDKTVHVLKAVWDTGAIGSTTGTTQLLDRDGKPAKLPIGSVVVDCTIDVKTSVALTTSWAANAPYFAFSTGVDASKDLKGNIPASTLVSTGNMIACTPTGSAATNIRITTESTPFVTITSAANVLTTPSVATAGKVNILIQYILSE